MESRGFVRPTRAPLIISVSGVHFALSEGPLLHQFTVTRGALGELEGSRLLSLHELEGAFVKHRRRIEQIAARKCKARRPRTECTTVGILDLATEGHRP
jgi:hypothetical protein